MRESARAAMSGANPFETDLDKNPANYAPLTPLGFIERAAYVYPDRTAVIHGSRRYAWAEMYACDFGVPMTGAVLNALNTRLDPETIAFMLDHGGAKVLITDREFSGTVE